MCKGEIQCFTYFYLGPKIQPNNLYIDLHDYNINLQTNHKCGQNTQKRSFIQYNAKKLIIFHT